MKGDSSPLHLASTKRLNRVKGQIDAVVRMIDERKYCLEIIQQIRAATNALRGVEQEILRRHLEGCVSSAMTAKDSESAQEKIEEIIKLWR